MTPLTKGKKIVWRSVKYVVRMVVGGAQKVRMGRVAMTIQMKKGKFGLTGMNVFTTESRRRENE